MILHSTSNTSCTATWRDAVLSGLAPDGGLFLPTTVPTIPRDLLQRATTISFPELAYELSRLFLGEEVSATTLEQICHESFSFPAPVVAVDRSTSVLELFHGPTCAFKDFGARFMARLFRHFVRSSASERLTVLVATSGDTGSAVANAFLDTTPDPLIRVSILFPKGKVSLVQEKQMTTLGHNVTAFEVDGTFDDCQRLVKQALADKALAKRITLTTANSINIARLLPQFFYYVWAALQTASKGAPLFVVPSGNLGNLTGGVMAARAGLQVAGFIAACNANDVYPRYLSGGEFVARPSQETLSNAMDVGNPSNFARIRTLTRDTSIEVRGASVSDDETVETIKRVYQEAGYLADPHTAVGFAALRKLQSTHAVTSGHAIVLATAHPAKFASTVERAIGVAPEFPPQLKAALNLPSQKVELENTYEALIARL